MSINSLNI